VTLGQNIQSLKKKSRSLDFNGSDPWPEWNILEDIRLGR
jgi:hypothetical protein